MANIFSRFFSSGVSTAIGVGVGGPAGAALDPAVRDVVNFAWNKHQTMPLEAYLIALGVAQGHIDETWAADEATLSGINGNRFGRAVEVFKQGPGVGEAFRLWRRSLLDEAGFRRALLREGIEKEWIDALVLSQWERVSPADVAAGVQQGHLPNPGLLPDVSPAVVPAEGAVDPLTPDGQPPTTVPLTQVDLDVLAELAAHGIDVPRAQLLANLAGLPPGVGELLAMWNRGEIDESSVDAGIREGHIKTKWAGAVKRLRWAVLGASEYANAHVRGWVDRETMYRGGALTGHTKSQMDLLYLNRGRPIAPVQAFSAWARDAPRPNEEGQPAPPGTFDFQDFADAIKRSDVQTRYIEPLWALRWAYPTLFQLGRLAQAGAITEERCRAILKKERYEPIDIDALATFWYHGAAKTKADPWVTKADNLLWTAIHKALEKGEIDRTRADAELTTLIADDATRQIVLARFEQELALPLPPTTFAG